MSGTMTPVNYQNWGNLVKTWALRAAGSVDENRLGDGNDYPVPTPAYPSRPSRSSSPKP
jgi:hypothetical protein